MTHSARGHFDRRHSGRRGAARLNIVWFIVALVFAFVGIFLAIASNTDTENALERMRLAQEDERQADAERQAMRESYREATQLFGWYDPDDLSSFIEIEPARQALTNARDAFGLDQTISTFQGLVEGSVPAYTARGTKISNLQNQINQLQTELTQKSQELSEVSSEKDQRIAELQSEINDLQQQSQSRQADLESELAAVRSSLGNTESQVAELRNRLDQGARQHEAELQAKTVRLQEMGKKLAFLREPEQPDGRVLEVDEDLGLAWIDLGKRDRLFRGMRFRIVDGRPGGDDTYKAMAEVTRVEEEMSEVRLYDRQDRFDPAVPGDVIYNPLYDPQGIRNAVFVGRFSGTYNEDELRALLSEIRIHIQSEVDKTTDYLIVGSELYQDENGEPLETPIQPSELPAYKEAVADGVQIVPLKQVVEFFRKDNV